MWQSAKYKNKSQTLLETNFEEEEEKFKETMGWDGHFVWDLMANLNQGNALRTVLGNEPYPLTPNKKEIRSEKYFIWFCNNLIRGEAGLH